MQALNLLVNAIILVVVVWGVFYIGKLLPDIPEVFVRVLAFIVFIAGIFYILRGGGLIVIGG